MGEGVGGVVAAAAYAAADQTDPEVGVGVADGAFVETGVCCGAGACLIDFAVAEIVLGVAAYGTA